MKMKILSVILSILGCGSLMAQGDWNSSFTYNVGIPLGNTADFIENTSFRGAMFQGDYFIRDTWSVGFLVGIQTFYEEMGVTTVNEGTLTVTGEQYRYLNSIPLLVTGKYHLDRFANITPHFGLGLGLYNMIESVEFAGLLIEDRNWQFGLMPEAGVGIELGPGTDFILNVQYNNYFESKDIDAQSYLGVNAGIRFTP